jgi:hypothetical protein
MVPSQESLRTNQTAIFYLRLIVEHELLGLDCLTHVIFHLRTGVDGSLQNGGKETDRVAVCPMVLPANDKLHLRREKATGTLSASFTIRDSPLLPLALEAPFRPLRWTPWGTL